MAIAGVILTAADAPDVASSFGARDGVVAACLSPDGSRLAYIVPGPGATTVAVASSVDGGSSTVIGRADGVGRLIGCGFSANDRIVLSEYGIADPGGGILPFTRLVATDLDGTNSKPLMRRSDGNILRISQFDGRVVDWLDGNGQVLMLRDNVPEESIGTRLASTADGISLERVDTRTLKSDLIEHAQPDVADYITDGRGVVRIKRIDEAGNRGILRGTSHYYYRLAGSRDWKPFSATKDGAPGLRPIAVDAGTNTAYALDKKDGRDALFRVALDGSMKSELAYANPQVDVDDVVTIGRGGRVIGASYVTDRRVVTYFDPTYGKLATGLSRALPKLPIVRFVDASADENELLLFASSDVDPGRYYAFNRTTKRLNELLLARPELEHVALATVKAVSYRSADGVDVPAYLTLPVGSNGRGLPAIVMPHGGPAARDEWGFDWLAQYFVARGYAVLQPNFRGSAGYGDAWFVDNGFKSWKTAIGDITDGARWLEGQGIADPAKLAIVGWSYGGYAALQANVMAPGLFKAVVAIAPVTDLSAFEREAQRFTNSAIVAAYVGTGPHLAEGSPVLHADRFAAPVLMFHGTMDLNVGVAESREMDEALRRAGKSSQLVIYPGLDHQLDDATARTDMLRKADAFLRNSMKL